MATLTASNPECVGGPIMATQKKTVENGQSWSAGQFLNISANLQLNECQSDDDAGTGGIKYLALTSQTDPVNTTTVVEVGIIQADHIFEGNELDGSVTELNKGGQYAIDVTSSVVTVDVGDTTNPAVVITEIAEDFNPGDYNNSDTKAKLRFKVLPTNINAVNA